MLIIFVKIISNVTLTLFIKILIELIELVLRFISLINIKIRRYITNR